MDRGIPGSGGNGVRPRVLGLSREGPEIFASLGPEVVIDRPDSGVYRSGAGTDCGPRRRSPRSPMHLTTSHARSRPEPTGSPSSAGQIEPASSRASM